MSTNKFKICPESGRYISGILPNGKRIEEPIVLPLNEREYIRCRSMATIFAMVGEPPKEVPTTGLSYEDALGLFNTVVEEETPEEPKHEELEPVKDNNLESPIPVASEVKEPVTDKVELPEEPKQEVPEQLSEEEDLETDEEDPVEEKEEIPEEPTGDTETKVDENPVKNNGFSNTTEHVSNDRSSDRVSSTKQNAYKGYNNQRNKNNKK